MQSGRAQDPLIRSVMREAWLLAALGDVELVIRHLPGADMGMADALSRESFSEEAREVFERFRAEAKEVEVGCHSRPSALRCRCELLVHVVVKNFSFSCV